MVINNIILPLSSKSNNKLKSPNLNLSYDLNSPIIRKLLSILTNNPINDATQLKIEQFLKNQSIEITKNKLSSKKI